MRKNRFDTARAKCLAYAGLVLLLLNLAIATSASGATEASPTVSTALSSTSVAVGASVYDTATLSGGNSPTGRIVYTDYQTADCSGQGDVIGNATVTGNANALPSFGVTFSSPGTYSFQAAYTGDSNNNPATSLCELLTVVAAASTTAASPASSSSTSSSSSTATASSSSSSLSLDLGLVVAIVVAIFVVGLFARRARGQKTGGSTPS